MRFSSPPDRSSMTHRDRITCSATMDNLPALMAFVDRACAAAGLDSDETLAVRLSIEEICANVISHGYAKHQDGDRPITVDFMSDADEVVTTIEDRGITFDPATAPAPMLTGDAMQRTVGGIGLHLVRSLMDEVRHEPVPGGGNRLTLVKRRVAATM
jgi:anti-sigma regulatory factor (Ser/Thr protein kinase)